MLQIGFRLAQLLLLLSNFPNSQSMFSLTRKKGAIVIGIVVSQSGLLFLVSLIMINIAFLKPFPRFRL